MLSEVMALGAHFSAAMTANVLQAVLAALCLTASCQCGSVTYSIRAPSVAVSWNGNSFDLLLRSDSGSQLQAQLGIKANIPADLHPPTPCAADGLCWNFGSLVSLNISTDDGQIFNIEWQSEFDYLKDCFALNSAHWYGGGEAYDQHWPIEGDNRPEKPYVTGDTFSGDFGGLMEPYWLNSDGFAIHADKDIPLLASLNASGDGQLCLAARYQSPYKRSDSKLHLRYSICVSSDVKSVHLLVAGKFWNKPSSTADERMFTHPIWSTWARYKTEIDQNRTLQFASEIRRYGFNDSQLEIDDQWETCYGELEFMSSKFPDPVAMIQQLKEQGFRVTIWIHPFINLECPSFDSAWRYLVQDANGLPALTRWWQGQLAGYFDFTRPAAADWWSSRVLQLRSTYGIDSFKIDAGESNWLPACFHFDNIPTSRQPNGYSQSFVENMERFGPMIEVRTGWNSQKVPVFTRMLDRDSVWTDRNGLLTLIPTLLQFSLEGYPFVLPDMIGGGNGFSDLAPAKELFVRWMQANVFMPAMQFSFVPWDYDQEVVDIALKMTALHAQYSEKIISLARESTENGFPINRPLWWIDPLDPEALKIDSEFLLGDDLLAAPVLQPGAVSRNIYLPSGQWRDEVDPLHPVYAGPGWLLDYPAPLDTLPYFTRISL